MKKKKTENEDILRADDTKQQTGRVASSRLASPRFGSCEFLVSAAADCAWVTIRDRDRRRLHKFVA